MWGELASHKRDLKPTIPSSQGWVSSVHLKFLVTRVLVMSRPLGMFPQ